MELTTLKCVSCGAHLDNFDNKEKVKCPYCGSLNLIMRPVKYNQTNFSLREDDNKKLINLTTILEKSIGAGNYTEAYNYCNKALEIDPSSASLWLNKALCAFWIRDEKTIMTNQCKEIFTYLNTAKLNNPNEDEFNLVTMNISYNLYYYCLYQYYKLKPDILSNDRKSWVYSDLAISKYIELFKTMELCFDIYKETIFLETIVKELSGQGKLSWGYLNKKGKECYYDSGLNKKKYYDGLTKRREIIEKIKSIKPNYIPIPLPIKADHTKAIIITLLSIVAFIIFIIVLVNLFNSEPQNSEPIINNVQSNEIYKITTQTLNLRKGPGEDFEIILKISNNESIEILDKTNKDWYRVKYNEQIGFASSKYLKKADE